MPEVSLTVFIDFATMPSRNRLSRVRRSIEQQFEEYSPAKDFYKPLRERIQELHMEGRPASELRQLLEELTDTNKENCYPPVIEGYIRFIGRKDVDYFEAPRATWEYEDLLINVNPELGLEFGGDRYFIKLWFTDRKLDKRSSDASLGLMQEALEEECLALDAQPAILDVRRSNLIEPTVEIEGLSTLVAGEAAMFRRMWNELA